MYLFQLWSKSRTVLKENIPVAVPSVTVNVFTEQQKMQQNNTLQECCHRSDLYPPSIKLSKYQKGVYYSGIKTFNQLPQNIKNLSWNAKKFKLALKRFLLMGSFYTLDEYFDWISRSELNTFI
jgi:hypothetical protein